MKRAKILSILAVFALPTISARADDLPYSIGDLLMGFRYFDASLQTSDPSVVLVNLGQASLYENPATPFAVSGISSLGTDLAGAFGENWFTDGYVRWGVAGVNDSLDVWAGKGRQITSPLTTSYNSGTSAKQTTTYDNVNLVASNSRDIFNDQTTTSPGGRIVVQTSVVGGDKDWSEFMTSSAFGQFPIGSFEGLVGPGAAQDLFKMPYDDTAPYGPGTYQSTFAIDPGGGITVIPEPSPVFLVSGALVAAVAVVMRRRKTFVA